MKKIFAVFCAVVLMPSFSAHAWIGGPWSNNSFFGEDSDDGVYEAVAIPDYGQVISNGIGMFRWAVTNNRGFDSSVSTAVSTVQYDDEGNVEFTFVDIQPLTSNVYFGGVGQISHVWFIEGVSYRGNCQGSANSGLGEVFCVGQAQSAVDTSISISSGFNAQYDGSGFGIPISRFSGYGDGTLIDSSDPDAGGTFTFFVMGSKVTSRITYNGIEG